MLSSERSTVSRDSGNLGIHLSFVYVSCGGCSHPAPSRLIRLHRVHHERLMHASQDDRRPSTWINWFVGYYRASRQVLLPKNRFTFT